MYSTVHLGTAYYTQVQYRTPRYSTVDSGTATLIWLYSVHHCISFHNTRLLALYITDERIICNCWKCFRMLNLRDHLWLGWNVCLLNEMQVIKCAFYYFWIKEIQSQSWCSTISLSSEMKVFLFQILISTTIKFDFFFPPFFAMSSYRTEAETFIKNNIYF